MIAGIIESNVKAALAEDIGSGDITSSLLNNITRAKANIIAKEQGVLCGLSWVNETYRQINANICCTWHLQDGKHFSANQTIATIKGPSADLLIGERAVLNWLQTLSGTATTVAEYVAELKTTQTQLLDTRKTIPGLRYAQKYAVRCGGGVNHRMGLFDAFLIKENHIKAYGSIKQVIKAARQRDPEKTLEIEVQNIAMLQEALLAKPDIILLDNFDQPEIAKAVHLTKGSVKLEASGNMTKEDLLSVAKLGVDYISVGAVTKNIKAVDFSFLIE